MGLWGSIKKIGKQVGGVVSKAAPFAGLIPGVGPLAAGALGAGGALISGKNLKDIAKAGLVSGGGAFLGGKALGALKGVGGGVPDVLRNGVPSKVTDLLSGGGAVSSSGGGGILDKAKSVGSGILGAIKNHPELALAGVSALQSARSTAGSDKLYDQGLGDIRGAYAAKAPLRAMALNQLQNPKLKDLSSVFQPRGNPFGAPVVPPPVVKPVLPFRRVA